MRMQPWQGDESDRQRVLDNLSKVVGNLQSVPGNLQKVAINLQRQARAPGATTVYKHAHPRWSVTVVLRYLICRNPPTTLRYCLSLGRLSVTVVPPPTRTGPQMSRRKGGPNCPNRLFV